MKQINSETFFTEARAASDAIAAQAVADPTLDITQDALWPS